jgi:hypothetical protein
MNEITMLLDRCKAMGAVLTASDGRLIIEAPRPLPDDVLDALRKAKAEILDQLNRNCFNDSECWPLEQWRLTALPEWRKQLRESITSLQMGQARYAYWVLKEVLEDPEYKENR